MPVLPGYEDRTLLKRVLAMKGYLGVYSRDTDTWLLIELPVQQMATEERNSTEKNP